MTTALPTPILKVAQLNLLAKRILEGNFPELSVEGEISNLARPASGHIYFSLKDETAMVRAVMFRPHQSALTCSLRDGMTVIVTAGVSLYEARGDYQLIVEKIVPVGIGTLQIQFLRLKERLAAQGWFDNQRKKALPRFPKTIGIITSQTGAVIHDIMQILKRRAPRVTLIVYPTAVQGKGATEQIVNALKIANLRNECEVLILARGGGSLEDLWPFNEELVAQAILQSQLPVISAIGHETDFTIADWVADLRAPTPSAAAELVVPDLGELLAAVTNLHLRLTRAINTLLRQQRLIVNNLAQQLPRPNYLFTEKFQRLDELNSRLTTKVGYHLQQLQERLARAAALLNTTNPLATLARGYAILTQNNQIVRHAAELNVQESIQIKMAGGELQCSIQHRKLTAG